MIQSRTTHFITFRFTAKLLTLPTKLNRRINKTINYHVLFINIRKYFIIIIPRHSLLKTIQNHKRLVALITQFMQGGFLGTKIIRTNTKRRDNTRAYLITINRLRDIFGNIRTCFVRHIPNKNKAILPTRSQQGVMTGHIRIIAIYQSLRNIEKNTVIMGATAKSAKLTNKPMSDLFTIILTKTI